MATSSSKCPQFPFSLVKDYPELWIHIDAAYAGVTLACPEFREMCHLEAINRCAHSFCTNFHKVRFRLHVLGLSFDVLLWVVGARQLRIFGNVGSRQDAFDRRSGRDTRVSTDQTQRGRYGRDGFILTTHGMLTLVVKRDGHRLPKLAARSWKAFPGSETLVRFKELRGRRLPCSHP